MSHRIRGQVRRRVESQRVHAMFPEVRINTVHIDESDISLCNGIMAVCRRVMYMVRDGCCRGRLVREFHGCLVHDRVVHVYVYMYVSPVEFFDRGIYYCRGVRVRRGRIVWRYREVVFQVSGAQLLPELKNAVPRDLWRYSETTIHMANCSIRTLF
jgi:hypothetical protein